MNRGERRGDPPVAEIEWLKAHLRCKSIGTLFAEYSETFGQPYSTIDSFRAVLLKHSIFPITETSGYDNLNEYLSIYADHGAVKWTYKGSTIRKGGIAKEPHWLWRWHKRSIKTPSGVSFRPYPIRLKERQFGQDLSSDDSL